MLDLYDIVANTRMRKARKDWSEKFNDLMHWPKSERIVRIDGRDRKSMVILRAELGIDADRFTHDYASELLRAAHVASISSLDRYLHDVVVSRSWSLLTRSEDEVPVDLAKLGIPAITARKALEKLRKNDNARPGSIVKAAIQEQLHRDYTFQGSGGVGTAASMLGIEDFWGRVGKECGEGVSKREIVEYLNTIVQRRNQIVHEADLVRKTRAKVETVRDIGREETRQSVAWVRVFVEAIDRVVEAEFSSS